MTERAGNYPKTTTEGRVSSFMRRLASGIVMAAEEQMGLPPEVTAEIHRQEAEINRIAAEASRRDQSDLGIYV